jgi:signal transduction histidine kinase
MKTISKKISRRVQKYHFELKHVIVMFFVLVLFQVVTSFVQKLSIQQFIVGTQEWYQRDSAERLANLIATSLELLMETNLQSSDFNKDDKANLISSFNIILTQQILQKHVEKVCLFIEQNDKIMAIDNGQSLYSFLIADNDKIISKNYAYPLGIRTYKSIKERLLSDEQIIVVLEDERTFHVFVPFVPKGEFVGALYLSMRPEFGILTQNIIKNFTETSMIFMTLLIFGLLSMFYIASYTVGERNKSQELLFEEREKLLLEEVEHKKESMFTNRIYHTYHKAEKIMGFIKEDLRSLSNENIDETKYRVNKYSNFVSRVIYDMKWYDPPLQAIRNLMFQTDINEVILFLTKNVFNRVSDKNDYYNIKLNLDENLPRVSINEFVIWEILEPLIQNSIDHSLDEGVIIWIETLYNQKQRSATIIIKDNGPGIPMDLLITNNKGIQKIFEENISTKQNEKNAGYGCFIAHEMTKQRCGWDLAARNNSLEKGVSFTISIPSL